MKQIYFERAIFLSWYCGRGDCKFCYMSTQKSRIKNPKLAKRTKESILVEIILCKLFDWKIEFLSGGYESYEFDELVNLIKDITEIYGEKVWLNIGTLSEQELTKLKPYIIGASGAVECINPTLHDQICPSKPVKDIEAMFKLCDKLGLKKSMTLILGLGETVDDIQLLKDFIRKHGVDQITFYRLKAQKGTMYEKVKSIDKEYYAQWVKQIRQEFPAMKIIVGSWLSNLDELSLLLESGADGITKFPSVKEFNSKHAKKIEAEVKKAGMEFKSNLTKKNYVNAEKELDKYSFDNELKKKIVIKLKEYLDSMN